MSDKNIFQMIEELRNTAYLITAGRDYFKRKYEFLKRDIKALQEELRAAKSEIEDLGTTVEYLSGQNKELKQEHLPSFYEVSLIEASKEISQLKDANAYLLAHSVIPEQQACNRLHYFQTPGWYRRANAIESAATAFVDQMGRDFKNNDSTCELFQELRRALGMVE